MSAVASFYVVPPAHVTALIDASGDPKLFDQVLETRATSLPFDESGVVFSDLDMLLDARGAAPLGAGRMIAESDRLSAALETTAALFDHEGARAELAALDVVAPTAAEIARYAVATYGEDAPELTVFITAGLAHLRRWLASVEPGSVGVMIVG